VDRAFTSRKTLQRIEQGDHGVSVGIYASVLNARGLRDRLAALADPANDEIGMELAKANLLQRVRSKKAARKQDVSEKSERDCSLRITRVRITRV